MNITKIPLEELLQDKADAQESIELCEFALLHGHKTYGKGHSIEDRLATEKRIVEKIDTELTRREEEKLLTDAALEIGCSK